MKALLGWTLGITIWVAVTFAIYLGCASINTPEGTCDPQTAWDKCTSITGPGPGNGR